MKRWIIEYFDIFKMCNQVIVMSIASFVSDLDNDVAIGGITLVVDGDFVPIMGIREDGSIGGG